MSTQPEALRLAESLDEEFTKGRISNHSGRKAAAELRRLYEEVTALRQAIAEAEQTQPVAAPVLTAGEREALERFNETCEDGEGYDVPKPMMRRLAEIGVVHHLSRGIYGITKFGRVFLGDTTPPQRKPLSDEEIQECWYRTQGDAELFARAIEAAHDIKENT